MRRGKNRNRGTGISMPTVNVTSTPRLVGPSGNVGGRIKRYGQRASGRKVTRH